MPRSYLPVPEPYVVWRDNELWTDKKGKQHRGRYHVAQSAFTAADPKPTTVFDPREWYHEVEPGRTFRDRAKALSWLYTKLGKEMNA